MRELQDLVKPWYWKQGVDYKDIQIKPLGLDNHETFLITTTKFNESMMRDLFKMGYGIDRIEQHDFGPDLITNDPRLDIVVNRSDCLEKKRSNVLAAMYKEAGLK